MTPFDLAEPTSLADAIKLLDPDDPTIRPIGGGTALMLMMKAGVFRPAKLVSLRNIEQKYSSIAASAEGLRIGAMATLERVRALGRGAQARAAGHPHDVDPLQCTGAQRRDRRGALAHGDPHMDLPPVLIALGATMTAWAPRASASSRSSICSPATTKPRSTRMS